MSQEWWLVPVISALGKLRQKKWLQVQGQPMLQCEILSPKGGGRGKQLATPIVQLIECLA